MPKSQWRRLTFAPRFNDVGVLTEMHLGCAGHMDQSRNNECKGETHFSCELRRWVEEYGKTQSQYGGHQHGRRELKLSFLKDKILSTR